MKVVKRGGKQLKTGIALVLALGVAGVRGDPIPSRGSWYYDMGGSQGYTNFSARQTYDFEIGGAATWNVANACAFDPSISIGNYVSDVKRNIYGLESALLAAASSMATNYALDAIQKANPGLYDLITKSLAQANAKFEVAVKNCRQIREDIQGGQSPFEGLIKHSKQSTWTEASAAGDKDPVEVERELEENPGAEGAPWVKGVHAGGEGQEPIRVVEDTVRVGYPYWEDADSRMKTLFSDAGALVDYAHTVLGETTLRTCTNCQRITTRVGLGLKGVHKQERDAVYLALSELVAGEGVVTARELAEVSAPGMGLMITKDVIQGLRTESEGDQAILLSRLSGEVALQRHVERILILRHVLYAAEKDPNVAANTVALDQLQRHLDHIQRDLDEILWERKIRQEVASDTANVIVARLGAREHSTQHLTPDRVSNESSLVNGAIEIE